MTRLRIGDIEIDGSDVRIGGRAPAGTKSQGPSLPPSERLSIIRRLPLRSLWLGVAAGVVLTLGAGAVVLNDAGAGIERWLTAGALLLPVGLGLAGTALLKLLVERGVPLVSRFGAPDAVTERCIELLTRELTDRSSGDSVPNLARCLGWSEADVVRTLGWLRERALIQEDLDIETGQFRYVFVPPRPIDLDSRLNSLK
jgi:hypothetical protein